MTPARPNNDTPVADRDDAAARGLDPDAFDAAWQANFDTRAQAHDAIEAARAHLAEVELDARRCPQCLALPPGGVCGDHYARLVDAVAHRHTVIDTHRDTIERFKAGVTVAQIKAAG